tara:strand:+ start:226 stop:924 length:699 start_codon:yes stop_codon:yes gene_type:complete
MEIDFNEREKVSFKSFLIFSLFLLTFINTGFLLTSAYFRISEIELAGNNELFQETDFIKLALGQSIWLITDDTFMNEMLQMPTIQSVNIKKDYPNKITIELTEYDKILSITDLRSSVPKKSTLYKNMVEIESDSVLNIATLTITNGPVPAGFNGEMVSLIMTLKSYDLDANIFNFIYDGESFIGEYQNTEINFGEPLDLGSKSAAIGSLLANSECVGKVRFISKEDLVANCS